MNIDWSTLKSIKTEQSTYDAVFQDTIDKCQKDFVQSCDLIERDKSIILAHLDVNEQKKWGVSISDMFMKWRVETPPSIPSILIKTCEYLNIPQDHSLFIPALTACILGEIQNNNSYHNNDHFREVFTLTARICATHNQINAHPTLNDNDILLLLISAAIHDFSHDGHGNFIDGHHIASRLEKQALQKAKPYLIKAGLSDADFKIIELLVICTDVSRNKDGQSPAGISRDIQMAHQYSNLAIINAKEIYQPLINNAKTSLLSMLLCEADLSPSSGLSYDFAKHLTTLISMESSILKPNATTLNGFITNICHGKHITKSVQHLMNDNFNDIQKRAEQDSKNNVIYI